MRLLLVQTALVALLATTTADAAPPPDSTIVQQAEAALEQVAAPDGPGVAALIESGDHVIFRAARGSANIELGVPLTPDNVFRIASVTKMFTAATVLKLSEEQRLSLDDRLSSYFPTFPNAGGITIRELLNHTSGVSDFVHDMQPGFSRRDNDTATLIAEIAKRPPDFAPGSGWRYSNAGYILLGGVIEKVTGKPWHVAVHDELLAPIGMTHTVYGDSGPLVAGRAAGYTTDTSGHAVRNANYISITTPGAAGGLASTVDDLRLWMRALAGGKAISDASYRQMIAPTPRLPGAHSTYDYGLGTYILHVRGHDMIGHTGQIDGFTSAAEYVPDGDVTIVVLANDDNFDAQTMARRLAAIAMGQPYSQAPARPMSDAEMQALAGVYQRDKLVEALSIKDHQLYARRGSGNVIPLAVTADGQLHLVPDELSYFVPVREASGRITGLDYFENGDGPAQRLPRVATAG